MMYYRVDQIRLPIKYNEMMLKQAVAKLCKISVSQLISITVLRRSVDARKRLQYVLTVQIEMQGKISGRNSNITKLESPTGKMKTPHVGDQKFRPLVVGAGPAGLSAAWKLAKSGLKPLLIERGEPAFDRQKKVNDFWKKGSLDTESNVMFGEGGAGLFSDGKLTSRSKEKGRVREFLDMLVAFGASEDILIDAHPHIGTDRLLKIIPAIREDIIRRGGEIRWSSKLDDVIIEDDSITGAIINGETFLTDTIILAIGHSARDTYEVLHAQNITMGMKPFAIGVRVELPQNTIDMSQYHCVNPSVGHASFRLTRKQNERIPRACYSFCMCPGGQVISCAHSPGKITSNGMSYSKHSLPNGNAAFLVPVTMDDIIEEVKDDGPFAGVVYQEALEAKAFIAGGGDYALPAETLHEYLTGESTPFPEHTSPHRINKASMKELLPEFISDTLTAALPTMLAQLGSPSHKEVMLYGVETRSSAPLQIKRDPQTGESLSTKGLYPTGEGAGYAGGIVSSGVDGLKAAEEIIKGYI